jgi:acetyl esterase/lipase
MRRILISLFATLTLSACNGDLRAYFGRDLVDVEKDISYIADSSSPRQTLDLYLPREVTNFPVVVFVHGGYWIAQDKDYYSSIVGLYGNVGYALARRGIGTAVINYRLVPDVSFDEQFADVANAIKWTQTNLAQRRGDVRRMVLMGHSAGGHITALAAFDPKRLQSARVDLPSIRGFAPLSPIFDLEDMAATPSDADFNAQVTKQVFGTQLKEYSPRTYFTKSVAPMFVALGEIDEPFLVTQVPRSIDELKTLGAPVTLLTLSNHSHSDVVVNIDTNSDILTPALVDFIMSVTK